MVFELKNSKGIYGELKYNLENFQHFSKHSHESFNIVAIKNETISIKYHKQDAQTLEPNEIAVFNPNQVHLTNKETKNSIPYYSLHLDIKWLLAIQKELYSTNNFLLLSPNIIKDKKIYSEFIKICDGIINNKICIEKDLYIFFKKLFSKYCNKELNIFLNPTILKVKHYIIKNLDCNINIDEIAKAAGYSSAHLNRMFKEEYGLTLHAFLIDKRIEKAKKLIRINKDATLTQIAYKTGFFDQSHFIRNFKKVYSLSPKKYKYLK